MHLYKPTKGDKAYAAHVGSNPMDNARLLRNVSDDYLSALMADNGNPRSAGFQEQLRFEIQRRAAAMSRAGIYLRVASLIISIAAFVLSVIAVSR